MAFYFSRITVAVVLAVSSVTIALGQETDGTEVDQEVALAVVGDIPSTDPLIATCAIHPPVQDNVCLDPTQSYLDALLGQNLPAAENSQALADLVIRLVPLAPSGEDCGVIPSEVPASIRLIAAQTTDPDQAAQFIGIATTLEECSDFQTAAVAPQASPN